uniref:Arabidopsis retrotransposon Orf1 C-terminal domain-containing protein n=1 Tax=Chenopodium quinoa TaxID=63459 RepID=A0A803N511_CHEQI
MARSSTNTKKKTTPSVSNSRIPPFFKTKKTVLRANTLTRKTSSSTSCAKVKEKVNIDYYDIKFWDAAHRSNYETLFKRGVNSTRFCDIDALRALRIEEDVCWLFTNVGWGDFLMKRYPTYKRIKLEFLSSLKAVTHSAEGCGEGSITFQLYNEEHTWTLTKFNEVLGLPNEGPRLTSKYWSADPIWRTLTDDREYDSNNSPGNHIRHPSLRYVQRLLSCTVFGRYEGGKARKDELFMLDRMLHGQPINTGAFLIKQMRDLANKTTTSGAIVLGGLITPIAFYLGHKERLVTEESIGGVDALDISACALMNWIVKKDGTTLWCIKGIEDVLPPAENMSLRVEGNWSFGKVEPLACVSIPHEPLSPPPMTEVPTPAPIEGTLNILLTSVDEIKTEQKEIKEQLKSMSTFLATLSTWIQSRGVANPPYFSP